jgi:hypothetical protein
MRRYARGAVVATLTALAFAAGCKDATSAGSLTLAVIPASRSFGIDQDSIVLTPDSVVVSISGSGSATAPWTTAHGSANWLTLVGTGGTGSGVARWVLNPIYLAPGIYVDTITITAAGAAGSPARVIDSLTVRGTPAQLITVRRAWLPGERAATIALWQRNGVLVIPFAGDLSYLADQLLDRDSTTVVVTNPLYNPALAPGMSLAPQFASGWGIIGFDLTQINKSNTPYDTLNWNGVKWWNPADSTWVGIVVNAVPGNTYGLTTVSTSAFNASGGKSGAGGGEAQKSTGTYWEASGGQINISYNGSCGTATTVASGVYKGGTVTTCSNGGRMVSLSMPRLAGSAAPATQTINFDWRTTRITGFRFTCIFPSPCTSAAAASVASLRAQRVPLLRYWMTRPR